MGVDDAIDVVASAVDCAVNDEPGLVHGSVRLLDEIAIEIDLDEVRGRHLLEQQAETVEQEMTGLARNARRNVGVDQIGPTEMLHQAVARGEIDALLPFGGIDVRPCGSADGGCDRRHSRLSSIGFSRPSSNNATSSRPAGLPIISAAAPPPERCSDRRMSARRWAA